MGEIWKLVKETFSCWNDVGAPRLGAALAFYTVVCAAPLLVVSVGISGLAFGREAAQGQIMWQIQGLVGPEGASAIQAMLQHARKPSSGLIATAVGLIVLLFGASGVFGELRDSMNTIWGVRSASGTGLLGMIKYRFFSFAMVLGVGFLLLVLLVVSAVISAAGKFFEGMLPVSEIVLHLGTIAVSFAAITVLFALLYKLVPDVKIDWQDVWIGAAVTAFLFSVGKFLIGLYLGKASVASAYGAAGSLVVILLWVYYSAQIFFIGAEFTRAYSERHGSRAKSQDAGAGQQEPGEKFRHPQMA